MHSHLGRYISRGLSGVADEKVARSLSAGDPWAVIGRLGARLDPTMGGRISLEQLGALRALSELGFLQLTIGAQGLVLQAANKSIDDDPQVWLDGLVADLREVADALHGDRMAVAVGFIGLYWMMNSNLRPDSDGLVRLESFSSIMQAWWLGRQAAAASVERICEVGFNAGHSAMAMLMAASPTASLISFDIGLKSYTAPCADFVGRVFPGRFRLVEGPSNVTVFEHARKEVAAPHCDLIYIDGGHSEQDASDDLLGMSLLARRDTLLVMDDVGCPSHFCDGPALAWEKFKAAGRIREMGCEEEHAGGASRKWCWGRYL